MSQLKNNAFQFATSGGTIIADVSGLTVEEARRMWMENIQEYKRLLRAGKEPEMVIWCGMQNETDYRFKFRHWWHENMHLDGDDLYMIVA